MRIIKGKTILILDANDMSFKIRPEYKLAVKMLECIRTSLDEVVFVGSDNRIKLYQKALKNLNKS